MKWQEVENNLLATDPRDYAIEWGIAREAYVKDNGPFAIENREIERLKILKNKYFGKSIFVIGNGPSLTKMNLDYLKDKYTFGVNRFYLMYDKINWKPTFYTANDWRVVPDNVHEINSLTSSRLFIDNNFKPIIREDENVNFYQHIGDPNVQTTERIFSTDASRGVRGAGSVVGSAIQLAAHLGFKRIFLIGCDLSYVVNNNVLQEGDDRFGNGVKLELTSTEDDDPNHFDPRYFGTGKRWHDPNVKRMVEGHNQCLKGSEANGITIYNATLGGDLEVYPRISFEEAVALSCDRTDESDHRQLRGQNYLIGPFDRDQKVSVDETHVIHDFVQRTGVGCQFMVDIGAHHGSSLIRFFQSGTTVLAFEPDPKNRAALVRNIERERRKGQTGEVHIIPKALSGRVQPSMNYYSSDESSGISGLLPFRDSHEVVTKVDVSTLDVELDAFGTNAIEFLKIDVEGFEARVLEGLTSWPDTLKFLVIEYEDDKSVKNGNTTRVMVQRLIDEGFRVYVSEWWPIERYGTRHSLRSLQRISKPLQAPTGAWGNLIALCEQIAERYEDQLIASYSSLLAEKSIEAERRIKDLPATPALPSLVNGPQKASSKPIARPAYPTIDARDLDQETVSTGAWATSPIENALNPTDNYALNVAFQVAAFDSKHKYDSTFPPMLAVMGDVGLYFPTADELRIQRKEKILGVVSNLTLNKTYRLTSSYKEGTLRIAINGRSILKDNQFQFRPGNKLVIGSGYLQRKFIGKFSVRLFRVFPTEGVGA